MKRLLLVFSVFVLLSGCEDSVQDLKKGFVYLSIPAIENGRTGEISDPAYVLISVADAQSNVIEQNKKIPLYRFGNSWVSESLQLVIGQYRLTSFMVLDADSNVIYAAPVEGSLNAGLVNDPLPIDFVITENGSTLISPQVIEVSEESSPENFGYVSFAFVVVDVPTNININFLMPQLPYFTTNGYDSIVITVSTAEMSLSKKLDIIGPIEATGDFFRSAIPANEVLTITVKAYHEVIDEVLYNFHVNESVATVNATLDGDVDEIEIGESALQIIRGSEAEIIPLTWDQKAHVIDETGYFHVVLDNNFCVPDFSYVLESNTESVYYQKVWYYNNSPGVNQLYADHYEMGVLIPEGSYTDNNTFDGIDCDLVDLNMEPSFFFYLIAADGMYADCLIVWQSLVDPHDPVYNGRTKEGSPAGYFRMSLSGIEKYRAEAYERMKK